MEENFLSVAEESFYYLSYNFTRLLEIIRCNFVFLRYLFGVHGMLSYIVPFAFRYLKYFTTKNPCITKKLGVTQFLIILHALCSYDGLLVNSLEAVNVLSW